MCMRQVHSYCMFCNLTGATGESRKSDPAQKHCTSEARPSFREVEGLAHQTKDAAVFLHLFCCGRNLFDVFWEFWIMCSSLSLSLLSVLLLVSPLIVSIRAWQNSSWQCLWYVGVCLCVILYLTFYACNSAIIVKQWYCLLLVMLHVSPTDIMYQQRTEGKHNLGHMRSE